MGALRKAGVWLGLIEDDDDRGYGYDDRSYDEDYPDDEIDDSASVVRARVADRLAEARAERIQAEQLRVERVQVERLRAEREHAATERPGLTSVRQIHRQPPVEVARHAGETVTYPTRENLALAAEEVPAAPAPHPVVAMPEERRYQITTLHPTSFSEGRTIGEQFRDGVPVILNLTEMAEADAKRLVDFAAGLAFGLRGTMERVTNRVFLLSPANIQVTAEDKAKIAEGGFFRS